MAPGEHFSIPLKACEKFRGSSRFTVLSRNDGCFPLILSETLREIASFAACRRRLSR